MSLHAWRQAWFLLTLLVACSATDEVDAADTEREKPKVLTVIEEESKKPDPTILGIRVLQRHGRAPIPPAMGHSPSSDEELMREFDEVTVEWHTAQLVSSVLLRLPERQEEVMKTNATYDGYKFFLGPKGDCKFDLADKHVLPDDATVQAHNVADTALLYSCKADNSDPTGVESRRSAALLKLHAAPHTNYQARWNYFTMLIRNPLKTPVRNSVDLKTANTFQLVMNNTEGKTLVAMSFEALKISPPWVCSYTPWFRTTTCSAACGGGHRVEVRRKLHAPPLDYDPKLLVNCFEATHKYIPCNQHECNVDCDYYPWEPAGDCSRSCGNGTQVERRYVKMGPKGKGKICPPWHTTDERTPAPGYRVRVVPCNQFPCEPSCNESKLADKYRDLYKASPIALPEDEPEEPSKVAANATNTTKTAPEQDEPEEPSKVPTNATSAANPAPEEDVNTEGSTTLADAEEEEAAPGTTSTPMASMESEDEGSDANESLLSIGSSAGGSRSNSFVYETPRLETGLVKSACTEPCGGGRRMVLIPSDKKVSGGDSQSCSLAFEEDCNQFPCTPLMLQPANGWQYPIVGKWFMVDVSFVVEELSESFTFRAPPDFLLAATGSNSECFLVEHSLPNLESCSIFPGQASERTGPIMVFNFSNPLEPQNSFTWKRDWYYFRTWVQHPKECTGGIKNGRCLGQVGERQWVMSIRDSQPEPLWETVKGSYEIFANESVAKEVFEANGVRNLSWTEDADEQTTTTESTTTTTTSTEEEETSTSTATEPTQNKAKKSGDGDDTGGKDGKEGKEGKKGKASDKENKGGSDNSLLEGKVRPAHGASHSDKKTKAHHAQHHTRSSPSSRHKGGHDLPEEAHHAPHAHHRGRSHRKTAS